MSSQSSPERPRRASPESRSPCYPAGRSRIRSCWFATNQRLHRSAEIRVRVPAAPADRSSRAEPRFFRGGGPSRAGRPSSRLQAPRDRGLARDLRKGDARTWPSSGQRPHGGNAAACLVRGSGLVGEQSAGPLPRPPSHTTVPGPRAGGRPSSSPGVCSINRLAHAVHELRHDLVQRVEELLEGLRWVGQVARLLAKYLEDDRGTLGLQDQ